MQIIEVKNNLARINYDPSQEPLVLSGFMTLKDLDVSFIAQIMHLEASQKGAFAVLKLLFNFDAEGVITNYNGSIPSLKSVVQPVATQELLGLLPVETPIVLGELAQQKTTLTLDKTLLEEKLLICSEKISDTKILIENTSLQLTNNSKKVVIVDLSGDLNFSKNKITACQDFKLPLNYETINFIYDKGLDDANAETKALIQDVFLEVQNYVKTLEDKFIPFNLFKSVVDEQYQELKLVELVLLKNKLLKFYEAGIFAQEKSEFDSLRASLNKAETTIFDLSQMDENIQREAISYLYSLINQQETYVMVNINNSNSDKKLLKQIVATQNAYSTIICPYTYKYLTELKQISKNLILFAPIQQQQDFASYNTFLSKLNPSEFIVNGSATHNLPLIVKLEELSIEPQTSTLDEEIKKDVDQIYTAPKPIENEPVFEELLEEEPLNDTMQEEEEENSYDAATIELTEDDLDFIEETEEEQLGSSAAWQHESLEEEAAEEEEEEQVVLNSLHQPENLLIEDSTEEAIGQATPDEDVEYIEENPSPLHPFTSSPEEEILPIREASVPIVPIYSANVEPKGDFSEDSFEQGDIVTHAKYGKGTVEKLISYGSKTLCSIHFDNVGRRLLDPSLAEIKKV